MEKLPKIYNRGNDYYLRPVCFKYDDCDDGFIDDDDDNVDDYEDYDDNDDDCSAAADKEVKIIIMTGVYADQVSTPQLPPSDLCSFNSLILFSRINRTRLFPVTNHANCYLSCVGQQVFLSQISDTSFFVFIIYGPSV